MFDWTAITASEAERFMRTKEDQPIRQILADRVGKSFLYDLGCGRGIGVKDLWHRERYIGVDASQELVKVARRDNPGYLFFSYDLSVSPLVMKMPFGVLKSVLEHQPSLETAKAIYDNCVRSCETLLVAWHTPPHYPSTEIITVQAELDNPIFQNHYKEGSFERPDLLVQSERIDEFELWTVRSR